MVLQEIPTRMTGCKRCNGDSKPLEVGDIYLWFCNPHLQALCNEWLKSSDCTVQWRPDLDSVLVSDVQIHDFLMKLSNEIHHTDRMDVRGLAMCRGSQPTFAEVKEIRSLDELLTIYNHDWLADILDNNRLFTHFHPIVYAKEPDRVFANECLIRARSKDGSMISPGRLFSSAGSASMLQKLDQSARACSLRTIHQNPMKPMFFINFNPVSIYDPQSCLRDTFALLRELKLSPDQIVFEVVESEQIASPEKLIEILEEYRRNGFLVALDDIGSGYSSLNLLHRINPDFVKLDMELIRNVHVEPLKALIATKIIEIAREYGFRVVAEGVETFEEMQWVVDQQVDFVQGFYIARPEEIPRDVITVV